MNWPEDYYRQHDGDKRWAVLKEYTEENGSDERADALAEIWKIRYERNRRTGEPVDRFVKAWLDLAVASRKSPIFGVAGKRKVVQRAVKTLHLDSYTEADALTRELLDAEYEHLFRLIIYLECDDHGFTHRVLGFTKLSNEALQNKIAGQLTRVLRELPKNHQIEPVFAPLEAAGVRAFAASFEGEPVL